MPRYVYQDLVVTLLVTDAVIAYCSTAGRVEFQHEKQVSEALIVLRALSRLDIHPNIPYMYG